MSELAKGYLTLGAGGLSLVVLVWLLVYIVVKISPKLESLSESNAGYKEVIENNTRAIEEVSKSNDNVASALKLLDQTNKQLGKSIDKVDSRTETMIQEVVKVKEVVRNCERVQEQYAIHGTDKETSS